MFLASNYPSWSQLLLLMPEIQLTLFACFVLVIEVFLPSTSKRRGLAYLSLAGVALAALGLWQVWQQYAGLPRLIFYEMYIIDNLAIALKSILLLAAGLSILLSLQYFALRESLPDGFYGLLLLAVTGMLFIASSYDLLSLYISLELMAITVYILVGYRQNHVRSSEAALKYFVLGIFSSGILLYGISLIYGITGQTNLRDVSIGVFLALQRNPLLPNSLLILGMVLMAVGVLFKVAAVPFHMWAPDAYEGAALPITAFMSIAVKTASYALLIRIFWIALLGLKDFPGATGFRPGWTVLLGAVAAITLVVGNIAASTQQNLPRLLAYSAIAHTGYLLLGVIAGNSTGYSGVMVYLLTYVIMTAGAFGVLIVLQNRDQEVLRVEDLRGLAQREPLLATAMTIFLLSLAGLPVTAGFIGKYLLFGGLIKVGNIWYTRLVVLAVLTTIISFYFYTRLIKAMFAETGSLRETTADPEVDIKPLLYAAAVVTLFIGIYPQPVITFAELAIADLSFEEPANVINGNNRNFNNQLEPAPSLTNPPNPATAPDQSTPSTPNAPDTPNPNIDPPPSDSSEPESPSNDSSWNNDPSSSPANGQSESPKSRAFNPAASQ
jgi:NADH-quinone oxidoreductase subunit N